MIRTKQNGAQTSTHGEERQQQTECNVCQKSKKRMSQGIVCLLVVVGLFGSIASVMGAVSYTHLTLPTTERV